MSSKNKDVRKESKNLAVTSRCVAIVFKQAEVGNNHTPTEETHVELHEEYDAERCGDVVRPESAPPVAAVRFEPKQILDEFKLRNKTCYWNPALSDSVASLEYVGFIEPLTLLVKGDDIHLENIRTAWGRRVLKDPAHFKVERIGDVNGIEMQVIPQTQFIPLPEALCLIILDLNTSQIVATLDTVCERLRHTYQGLHLPSNQLVYETLGTLIRTRKVFHTGCGYFVVTPDTFRMHANEGQVSSFLSPWTHLHPMYIPAAFSQPMKQPTRSISCQVDVQEELVGGTKSCDTKDKCLPCSDKVQQINVPSPRLLRSMSVSARRARDRGRREEVPDGKVRRRSNSLKGPTERPKTSPKICVEPDVQSEPKSEKSKEKVSLFSKIFGKGKKKPHPEPKKPEVEYATFSAQFPPPEWKWYQQQVEKHLRTESWVQQQVTKSDTWHHRQSPVTEAASDQTPSGSVGLPERPATLPITRASHAATQNFVQDVKRKSGKKSHRHKDRSSVVIANNPQEALHFDSNKIRTYRNSMGQTNIRLSSLPTRLSPTSEVLHSNYISHPIFSSTPRVNTIPESSQVDDRPLTTKDIIERKQHSLRKSHRSKKKSHQNRHSSFYPTQGDNSKSYAGLHVEDDISYQYQGRLPQKHSAIGVSQSSGVNCAGLDDGHNHSKGHGHQRSRPHKHAYSEVQDSTVIGPSDNMAGAHIYANVHITNAEVQPQLPERTRRKSHKPDLQREVRVPEPLREDNYRLSVKMPESDRRSENNSDRGTVKSNSNSSQGQSSHDSALDGTESSEHSMGTVINTKPINKHLDRLTAEALKLTLGDSGFSSPRVSENSGESSKKTDCNLTKEHNKFMCNNLKTGVYLNNSSGKLDEFSDDSAGRITADTLYENVRIDQTKVLNNLKYLHKEITVSNQNLTVQPSSQDHCNAITDMDSKQAVVKKFNFDGDFHVVGVV